MNGAVISRTPARHCAGGRCGPSGLHRTGDAEIRIIRQALRAAATATTVFDALDITGDALRQLAQLARAETRNG